MTLDYSFIKSMHYISFYMHTEEDITRMWHAQAGPLRFARAIISYGLKCIRSLLLIPWSCGFLSGRGRNKIIFFFVTKNNLDALIPICENMQEKALMVTNNHRFGNMAMFMPMFVSFVLSFLYVPRLVRFYMKAPPKERRILTVFCHQVLLSMGYYHSCRIFLYLMSPRAVVFANDHTYHNRMLVDAAEKVGMKCFYVQHSSVYDNVPKISFSFALLEGKHAKEKYLKVGSDEKKIKLIGMPKFDNHLKHINKNTTVRRIGVCTTRSMDFEETCYLVSFIRREFPSLAVVLRPHPNLETRDKYSEVIAEHRLEFSGSKDEDVFSFLNNVDAVISGNSSILLESALMNVTPLYYFGTKTKLIYQHDRYDKYDYVQNGVALPVDSLESLHGILQKLIDEKPDIRQNAKYYCDTVGTSYDGNSASLAAECLEDALWQVTGD